MKLYNHWNGIVLFVIGFMIWAYLLGRSCPCNKRLTRIGCLRHEVYGAQMNHLQLFIILGMIFPSYFFTLQGIGVLWELYEYTLDNNEDIVVNYIGGCLSTKPSWLNENVNPIHDHIVYKHQPKYVNPIDRLFNIENSRIHGWHGSVAEVGVNVFGFMIGYLINKTFR